MNQSKRGLKIETEIDVSVDYNRCEYKITSIKNLPDKFDYEADNVIIEAYIFGMDIIVYDERVACLTLKLSDMTSSIIARVVVSRESLSRVLESVKLGSSWRFYGECFNKQYDGMNVIRMQQIPQISKSLIDKEQEKYFFFEALDIETVKYRKKNALKSKMESLERGL